MSICLSTQPHGTAICTYQPHFSTELLKVTLTLLEVWVNREKFRMISTEAAWFSFQMEKIGVEEEKSTQIMCKTVQPDIVPALTLKCGIICF